MGLWGLHYYARHGVGGTADWNVLTDSQPSAYVYVYVHVNLLILLNSATYPLSSRVLGLRDNIYLLWRQSPRFLRWAHATASCEPMHAILTTIACVCVRVCCRGA